VDVAIVVALIAGVVTAMGWLVESRKDRRLQAQLLCDAAARELTDARLKLLGDQLRDLYGPLVCLVHEGAQSFRDVLAEIGRDHVRIQGRAAGDPEVQTWIFWSEAALLPRNQAVMDLLTSNTHLIDGDEFPDSFVRFIEHHRSWQVRHERWRQHGIEYDWHSRVEWPSGFESDVLSTFSRLKREQNKLLNLTAPTSTREPAPMGKSSLRDGSDI
jgi:hypothetical protein